MKHGNTTSTLCSSCGGELLAGIGRFVLDPTTRAVSYHHAGRCAADAGAHPGSSVTWGEVHELAAFRFAHDKVPESDAAVAVAWKEGSAS